MKEAHFISIQSEITEVINTEVIFLGKVKYTI